MSWFYFIEKSGQLALLVNDEAAFKFYNTDKPIVQDIRGQIVRILGHDTKKETFVFELGVHVVEGGSDLIVGTVTFSFGGFQNC